MWKLRYREVNLPQISQLRRGKPGYGPRQSDSSLNILNCSSNPSPFLLHQQCFPLWWISPISLQTYCNHLNYFQKSVSLSSYSKKFRKRIVSIYCFVLFSSYSFLISFRSDSLSLTISLKMLLSGSQMASLLMQRSILNSHLIWSFSTILYSR